MPKPIIFFSHSSIDAQPISRLKQSFLNVTGGSIEAFLSTDGQSIPLGRNWVHRVEEALDNSQLMIVFVSPAALRSSWIFFESGFAYAKKIRVVPVGFLGVDLSQLPPPLSLLQGFNIKSEEGLNNIIALANEMFGHSHAGSFTASDYQDVCGNQPGQSCSVLGEYGHYIDNISSEMSVSTGLTSAPGAAFQSILELFRREDVAREELQGILNLCGISFILSEDITSSRIHINIDPRIADVSLPLFEKAVSAIYPAGIRPNTPCVWISPQKSTT